MIYSSIQRPYLYFLPLYYFFVSAYTFVGLYIFNYAELIPYGLFDKISVNSVYIAITLILLSVAMYMTGWYLAYATYPRKYLKRFKKTKTLNMSKSFRRFVSVIGILLAFFYIYAYGLVGLLERESYTTFYNNNDLRNDFLLKIYFIIMPPIILLVAFVRMKTLRYTVLSCNFLVLLAASTRMLGLVFFLYAVGRYINANYRMKKRIFFLFAFAVYLFIFIFAIRNNHPQGLLPNLKSFLEFDFPVDLIVGGLNYISSFSVGVLAYSLEFKDFDASSFVASISPLPLSYHGGSQALAAQGIIEGVPAPMSAIAILYTANIFVGMFFYLFIGIIMFHVSLHATDKNILNILILSVYLVVIFFSLQYNLRGSMRLLQLIIFIHVFSLFYTKLKMVFRKPNSGWS